MSVSVLKKTCFGSCLEVELLSVLESCSQARCVRGNVVWSSCQNWLVWWERALSFTCVTGGTRKDFNCVFCLSLTHVFAAEKGRWRLWIGPDFVSLTDKWGLWKSDYVPYFCCSLKCILFFLTWECVMYCTCLLFWCVVCWVCLSVSKKNNPTIDLSWEVLLNHFKTNVYSILYIFLKCIIKLWNTHLTWM